MISLNDHGFDVLYGIFTYVEGIIVKYNIYSYMDSVFAIKVPQNYVSDHSQYFLKLALTNIDNRLLRFTTIYDGIYDKYILIIGKNIIFKTIQKGIKYYDVYESDDFIRSNVNIIPIYDLQMSKDINNFKEIISANNELMAEKINESIRSKQIQLGLVVNNIRDIIENLNDINIIDNMFSELYNIYDKYKNN